MTHSRAISEVTSATATEFQSGRSSTLDHRHRAGRRGVRLESGPSQSAGRRHLRLNTTDVISASSSFGARELAANYAQDINDRSQQNASSVRNRRASIVREVSQSEHEQISTRVLTNYNHMHALSIQYYEVVQAFRTTTQLERAERCLFVPVKLVDFSDPGARRPLAVDARRCGADRARPPPTHGGIRRRRDHPADPARHAGQASSPGAASSIPQRARPASGTGGWSSVRP